MNQLTIGQRIAACRKDLGLSQEALGEKLGVSRQAISKWEADGAMPDRGTLQAECSWVGTFLTAMLPLGSDYGYTPCFTIRHADGTQEQQMLEDTSVENLRSALSLPGALEGDGLELWLKVKMSNGMEGLTLADQWRYSGGVFEPIDSTVQ